MSRVGRNITKCRSRGDGLSGFTQLGAKRKVQTERRSMGRRVKGGGVRGISHGGQEETGRRRRNESVSSTQRRRSEEAQIIKIN